MKNQRSLRGQIAVSSLTVDATPRPYILNWKPNSAQRQLFRDYEKRELRDGASRAVARRRRLELTAAFEQYATLGTPWEQEIRAAIYADPRALRYLRFFSERPGLEWATIIRISMWAHAGDEHPTMKEMNREVLVPRDQVLSFLRERGDQGVTHTELAKTWPHYSSALFELRQLGFKMESTQIRNSDGNDDWRYVLKEEPRRYKLVKNHEEFARIARAIESLGRPVRLREAWSYAGMMARSGRIHERRLKENPLGSRFRALLEDDIVRVAGHHLKRMTYLMAVAKKTVSHSSHHPENLRAVLFERLHKRVQRTSQK